MAMLPVGGSVVLAVSGGGDSMAMLAAFADLARRRNRRWSLHVGHLNHCLRGEEADEDARFVVATAEQLGLPVTVERVDVAEVADREGGSIEEVARHLRYAFLQRLAERTASDAVATAHTAEDNAETVLHRICRGTGLRGLVGIPPSRPIRRGSSVHLIRPLIRLHRDQLRAFLRNRHLPWREDAGNLDPGPTRNCIRLEILPLLADRLNPRIVDALCRLAETAEPAWEAARGAAAAVLAAVTLRSSGRTIELDAAGLNRLPDGLAVEVLRAAMEVIGARLQGIGRDHLEAIWLMIGRGHGGKSLDLPSGLVAALAYGVLTLRAGNV